MQCYIVDAFSDRIFAGNPAAVCVLYDKWLPDSIMQNIAKEHNLSETAFCLCQDGAYALRWFTPTHEVDLCGHATLASGFVVLNCIDKTQNQVAFKTQSGILYVRKQSHGDSKLYELDLPSYALSMLEPTSARCAQMEHTLGLVPLEMWLGRDLVCVVKDEAEVRGCRPNWDALLGIEGALCHITARGSGAFDCVSRSFAPKLGVREDPVCGSGHCHIVPLWAQKLGKTELVAYQASARGGVLYARNRGERVSLSGSAVLFSRNEIIEQNLQKWL